KYDLEIPQKEYLELGNDENRLDILEENVGRVNYSIKMAEQRKGIRRGVVIHRASQGEGGHYTQLLDNLVQLDFNREFKEASAGFHRFTLHVDEIGDTFIDGEGWGKGLIFVNGFNLGRFWEVGPQTKLYVPGPLLKEGENEIILFETEGKYKDELVFTDQPVY